MNFVLDTNLVSEVTKPRPNANALGWHDARDSARLFITTITLGEVWQGFHRLPFGHPDYSRIKAFANDLPRRYRVLNFDARAAAMWGRMTADCAQPLPVRDSFIAAIARSRGFMVVTRDVDPFVRAGCKVLNPWN